MKTWSHRERKLNHSNPTHLNPNLETLTTMCLIIHSPNNHVPNKDIIESALALNPDGVGIMYMMEGRPVVSKSLNATVKSLTKKLDKLAHTDYAIHFRMRTHGEVNLANTHPYQVAGGRYLMHNGILPIGNEHDKTKSDTWHFIDKVLNPIIVRGEHALDWDKVGSAIGSSNKFAVLENGEIKVVNRKTGFDYEGGWFSNIYAWDAPKELGGWGNRTRIDYSNDDRYWDDHDDDDERYYNRYGARYGTDRETERVSELELSIADGICDFIVSKKWFYDLGNIDYTSYTDVYHAVAELSNFELAELMDSFFKEISYKLY